MFSVTRAFRTVSNTVSLVANPALRTLESSVSVSNALMSKNAIHLGAPCNSTYGNYWASFVLSEKEGFTTIPMVTVYVNKRSIEQIVLYSSNVSGMADSSVFTLANGGMNKINVMLSTVPVEAVNLSLTVATGVTNVATFKNSSAA